MLEARENPSYYWDPVSSSDLSASNPVNWVKDSSGTMVRCSPPEVPTTPLDELVFGAYIPQTYRYGAPPIPAHWATADCILTQASQYTTNGVANFRGIKVLETYPGEVDLRQSATVQELKMFGGRIKQDDPNAPAGTAGTIWVGQTLTWTGGTLNSNQILGIINLAPGATGVAKPSFSNPDVNGTVKLGSILILQGTDPVEDTGTGSTLSMIGGTFNLTNSGAFIQTMAFSTLFLLANASTADPVGSLTIDGQANTDAEVKIGAKSKAVVTTTRQPNQILEGAGYVNIGGNAGGDFENKGITEITNKTHLNIAKGNNVGGNYIQKAEIKNGKPVFSPITKLETNSEIYCGSTLSRGNFVVESGDLQITNRMEGGQPDSSRTATIYARTAALWAGATIEMLGVRYNTLHIDAETFEYMGGIRSAISAPTNEADLVEVTGKININVTTAKLSLRWGSLPTLNSPTQVGQRNWLLLRSVDDTIKNDVDPSRIDVSELDSRIKASDVLPNEAHDKIWLSPYIRPYV